MQIEKNVATIQEDTDDYRVVVTVEHRNADAITKEEAEFALTKAMPMLLTRFMQRSRS